MSKLCEGYCEDGSLAVYKDPEFPSGPITLCKQCCKDKLEELAEEAEQLAEQYRETMEKLS